MALLTVIVILFMMTTSSASLIWMMNQQQARAGGRLRSAAALAVAEAGVHRAVSILESVSPDRPPSGRAWRPAQYTEAVLIGSMEGRVTISVVDDPDGAVVITSAGYVAGASRKLRARVYLTSPVLLAALHGASVVRLGQPPAATFILPYGAGLGDRPWIHIAAGQEIWFPTTDVFINDPSAAFETAPGPMDPPDGAGGPAARPRPGPVRLLLSRDGVLTLNRNHQKVDLHQLRTLGVYVDGVVLRSDALPPFPEVDRDIYGRRAAENTANMAVNEAAGRYLGDRDLERKRDSLYTAREFAVLQTYLRTGRQPPLLRGTLYIKGGLTLEDQRLQITDGALIVEDTVQLTDGAMLEVTHSGATRTHPGIIVLDKGALIVTQRARLRVHGLVYASRVFDVSDGAFVDIVGAVVGNDPGVSFRSHAATVVIRYDPAVLGTPGLRLRDTDPAVAWVAAWEEVP